MKLTNQMTQIQRVAGLPQKYLSPLVARYGNQEVRAQTAMAEGFFKDGNQSNPLVDHHLRAVQLAAEEGEFPTFKLAGPRENLAFDPSSVKVGVVTCGGISPCLNNVIQAIVHTHVRDYQTPENHIFGFPYGWKGLTSKSSGPIPLTLDKVRGIDQQGGTILNSSRGAQDIDEMIDTLVKTGIDILYAIGGDGTLRAALRIAERIRERNLPISVMGLPKTMDNDLLYTDKSFGFKSTVEEAARILRAAHVETQADENVSVIVELFGRYSGYVAACAAAANRQVNAVLIPEMPFDLGVFLNWLNGRILEKGHALIVVAEGAGAEYVGQDGTDSSGNAKAGKIGAFLKSAVNEHFAGQSIPSKVTLLEPQHIIRAVPANAEDAPYCARLAANAVHGALTGFTGCVSSFWNNYYVYVPIELMTSAPNKVRILGGVWRDMINATGQPEFDK